MGNRLFCVTYIVTAFDLWLLPDRAPKNSTTLVLCKRGLLMGVLFPVMAVLSSLLRRNPVAPPSGEMMRQKAMPHIEPFRLGMYGIPMDNHCKFLAVTTSDHHKIKTKLFHIC